MITEYTIAAWESISSRLFYVFIEYNHYPELQKQMARKLIEETCFKNEFSDVVILSIHESDQGCLPNHLSAMVTELNLLSIVSIKAEEKEHGTR
jgi:hypothetical protein